MEEIKLEVEAVTPVFIAGADQRNIENEGLRPQSLRGLMRWWFRAAMGGAMWNRGSFDLAKLSMRESNVFGSQSRKSPVIVITHNSGDIVEFDARHYPQQINYFLFSMKGTRTSAPRYFIREGTHFQINLRGEESPLNAALTSLWLVVNLGGIGSRSRRFGGQIKEVSNVVRELEQKCIVSFAPNEGEAYEDFLRNNIQNIQRYLSKELGTSSVTSSNNVLPFPMIARNSFSILIREHQNANSWKDVVQDFGNIWSGTFDRGKKRVVGGIRRKFADRQLVQQIKRGLSGSAGTSLPRECNERRPFMGLPLNYFFMDLRPQRGVKLTAKGVQSEYSRRSSPISFGLTKFNDAFYSRVVIFKSAFLPEASVKWKLSYLQGSMQPTSDMNQVLSIVESDLCNVGWTKVQVL